MLLIAGPDIDYEDDDDKSDVLVMMTVMTLYIVMMQNNKVDYIDYNDNTIIVMIIKKSC